MNRDKLTSVYQKIALGMFLIINMRSTETIVRKFIAGWLRGQDSNDFRGNECRMHVLRLMKAVGDIVLSKHGFASVRFGKAFSVGPKRHSVVRSRPEPTAWWPNDRCTLNI